MSTLFRILLLLLLLLLLYEKETMALGVLLHKYKIGINDMVVAAAKGRAGRTVLLVSSGNA
jgi:hypothetical protein